MIDAIERHVLLRVIADRIYYWKEESAFEFEPTGKAIAIIDELESLAQEIKEIQGVDFAGNWSTDFSKLKYEENYLVSLYSEFGKDVTTHVGCYYETSFGGMFFVGDEWYQHSFWGHSVRAFMPALKPYDRREVSE